MKLLGSTFLWCYLLCRKKWLNPKGRFSPGKKVSVAGSLNFSRMGFVLGFLDCSDELPLAVDDKELVDEELGSA